MVKYYLFKLAQFIINKLPLKLSYRIAIYLSDLQYYFSYKDRKAVTNNLKVILPSEKNIGPIAREVFRNFGKYLVEFLRFTNDINEDFIQKKVTVKNLEYIKDALAQKKGVIILTAHVGNWELGGMLLGALGYPPIAIALPHKERSVNELFNQQRGSLGVSVVPINSALRRCLKALRNNEIIGVVADRDFTGNGGEILDFFGRKTIIPKGAAVFAYKTGAAIIPTFLTRDENDHFSLILEPPILSSKVDSKEHPDQDIVVSLMNQYKTVIERKIREYPGQWLMFREFWVKK